MNQPMHKRPRKARMRLYDLNANLTGVSRPLLASARCYLTGDEVLEELYAHAVALERMLDEASEKDAHEETKGLLNDFREAVDGVHDDLERKNKELGEIIGRFTSVIDDDLREKLAVVAAFLDALDVSTESTAAADALNAAIAHVDALASDADDIPKFDEQIDVLKGAWEDAGDG